MNNEDNQYMTFIENIKKITSDKKQLFYAGKVISTSPLCIDIGEMQLDREDLLINADLLKGTKRKVRMNSTEVIIENLEDAFKIGDKVELITSDHQSFILLCIVR